MRISGEATLAAACVSSGKVCCNSLLSMISLSVVVAPMCAPSAPLAAAEPAVAGLVAFAEQVLRRLLAHLALFVRASLARFALCHA